MTEQKPEVPIFGENGAVLNSPKLSEELRKEYLDTGTPYTDAIERNQRPLEIWHVFVALFGLGLWALSIRLENVGLAPFIVVYLTRHFGSLFILGPICIFVLRVLGVLKGFGLTQPEPERSKYQD